MNTTYLPRHRDRGWPLTMAYEESVRVRHCAGESCFHTHAGDEPLPVFADLYDVPVRCDRKGTHGGHDTDHGRCPGFQPVNGLPQERVTVQAARVRQEVTR